MRSEENAYKDLYYAERKAVCKYRSEALRYAIAYYKEKKQEIPTSYIKYTERSYLLQKGSALELLQKESKRIGKCTERDNSEYNEGKVWVE